MDSLSLLVVATGSVLVALVAFLGIIDYNHPVSDLKLSGIYPRRLPKRPHRLQVKAGLHRSSARHLRL